MLEERRHSKVSYFSHEHTQFVFNLFFVCATLSAQIKLRTFFKKEMGNYPKGRKLFELRKIVPRFFGAFNESPHVVIEPAQSARLGNEGVVLKPIHLFKKS